MTGLGDLPVTTLRGDATTFGELTGGRAALVVNVASKCGQFRLSGLTRVVSCGRHVTVPLLPSPSR